MFSENIYHSRFDTYIGSNKVTYILQQCFNRNINPLVVFTTGQKESSAFYGHNTRDLNDYYLGAKIHIDKKNGNTRWKSFTNQTYIGVYTLKKHFNSFTNTKIYLYKEGYVKPYNAATYSLYKYTPHYYVQIYGGYHGNKTFVIVWNRLYQELKIIEGD
jgi:hypothetical protein